MKKALFLILVSTIAINSYGAQIGGEIKEKFTGERVTDAAIIVKDKSIAVKSDDSGKFSIEIEDGDSLKIMKKGFRTKEITPSAIDLVIELEKEDIYYGQEIKIIAKKQEIEIVQKETSKTVISGDTIRETQMSGPFANIADTLASLPGISKSQEFSSLLYVRGSDPYDVLNVLNDVPLLNPYRWGGKLSVFNENLIDKATLYSGGYSARYPESMGGVLDVSYKEGSKEKFQGEVTLGADTSAQIGGPYLWNGTYKLSYKRTFYDLFMNKESSSGEKIRYPFFQEFYIEDNHKITERDTLKFWMLVSNEGMNYFMSDGDKNRENTLDSDKFEYDLTTTILTADWKHAIDDKSFLKLVGSYSNSNIGKMKASTFMVSQDLKVNEGTKTLIGEYSLDYGDGNNLKLGTGNFFHTIDDLKIDLAFFMPEYLADKNSYQLITKTSKTNLDSVKKKDIYIGYGYIENDFKLWDFYIKPGINLSYTDLMKNNRTIIDPRLAMRYELNPSNIVKMSIGQYSTHTLQYSTAEDNEDLKPEKTYHYVLGYENEITDDLRVKIEAYYKDMQDLFVADPYKENEKNGVDYKNIVLNIGKGYAEGLELFLQKKKSDNSSFDGWISYAYAITKRNNGSRDNTDWYYPLQDQRHTFNFTGNWYIKKGSDMDIVLKNKMDFHSGRPVQDFNIVKFENVIKDGDKKTVYIPIVKKDEFVRFDDYFRWDLSLEVTNKYRWGDVTWFAQMMNITDHKNVEGYGVSLFKGEKTETLGFPRMYMGGVKFNF